VLLLQLPFRDFFHSLLELALFDEVCHNGTTSNTRKSFCNAKTSGLFLRPVFRANRRGDGSPDALPEGDSVRFATELRSDW
jgi:hypothetical protein